MKKWSADRIVSITAIIVSLGTLFMIMYQTNLVRQEQKASVMPYLKIGYYEKSNSDNLYQGIILKNSGLGPAFIEKVRMLSSKDTLVMGPAGFVLSHAPDSIKAQLKTYNILSEGALIGEKQEEDLLRIKDKHGERTILRIFKFSSVIDAFTELEGDYIVEITYSSVYGDQWVIRSDLDRPNPL